ncbi:MAG: ABC transporter permease [Clostridiales bacterium]|nr:ABC transporter permease [Clostridiales bacterium]
MNRIWIITKNNLKLIFRNRSMLILTVLGTLLVIACVANAFHSLLDNAERDEGFTVGYEMQEGSKYAPAEPFWIEGMRNENITVVTFKDADPEKIIKENDIDVFVLFGKDSYQLTGNKKSELDTRIVQYVLYNMDMSMNGAVGKMNLPARSLPTEKIAGAENYYGLVEIVYFMSICSIFLVLIYRTERKSNIWLRFRISSCGSTGWYLGKYISCVLTAWVIQIGLILAMVLLLFDVHLGRPLVSIGVLMLAAMAYAAYGIIFLAIFENSAASIALMFMTLWFAGLFGGSFETYMYSSYPETLRKLSPTYYVNRTLVELSVNGSSDYLLPCVGILTLMIVVLVPVGMLITAKKEEA